VVASESCALDILGARYERPVRSGEVLVVDERGVRSHWLSKPQRKAHCIFEFIYFSRPDSWIFGEKVDKVRRKLGRLLATEHPAPDADIVISVPDSANTAALGYAEASGVRFEIGLIRNHYIGRTFIAPEDEQRRQNVRIKFNPVVGVLKDKSVVLVEDSVVRGNTLQDLIGILRRAGAREVHVRVSSPPIISPCYYGIDMPTRKELIASSQSVEAICDRIGATSLAYLSVEKMLEAVGNPVDYCTGCFSADYPAPVPEGFEKEMLGRGCIAKG
jgi:amidophosphoribosyltransferase